MKKSFLLSIFALAALASCQKDADIAVGGQTVEATFEATILTNATRTTAEVGDGVVSVLWAEDDAISMFAKGSTNSELTLEGEGGTTTGSFTGAITEGDSGSYIAYYPYAAANALNGTTLNVTLPAEQTYVEGSLASAPMLAVSQTKSLAFENLAALVRIVLKSEDNHEITSVALRGNAGEALAGAATVDVSAGTLALAQDAEESTLMLDCGEGITLSAGGTSFYFVVPAMTLANGFTIVATCADGDVMTKSTNNSVTLEAAKVYDYEAIEFEANTVRTPEDLKSAFENGGAYILASDINLNLTEGSYITIDEDVTIDLSGNTLTTSTVGVASNPDDITITGTLVVKNGYVKSANTAFFANNGTLTLANSEITSTSGGAVVAVVLGDNGKLEATNCTVYAAGTAFMAVNGADMTLTNCTALKTDATSSIALVAAEGTGATMTINGGSYTGLPYDSGYDKYVMGVMNGADATINTTVENGNGGLTVIGASTANLTGGSYSGGKACGLYVDGGSTVTYATADDSETPCQFSGVEGAVVAGNMAENSVDTVNGQEYPEYTVIVE